MNNPNESNPPAAHEHRTGGVSAETGLLCGASHNAAPQRQSGAERLAGGSAELCRALVKKSGRFDNQCGCAEYRQIRLSGNTASVVRSGHVDVSIPSMFDRRPHVARPAVWINGKSGDIFCDDRGRHYVLVIDIPADDPEPVIFGRMQEESHRLGIVSAENPSDGAERAGSQASDDSTVPPHNMYYIITPTNTTLGPFRSAAEAQQEIPDSHDANLTDYAPDMKACCANLRTLPECRADMEIDHVESWAEDSDADADSVYLIFRME